METGQGASFSSPFPSRDEADCFSLAEPPMTTVLKECLDTIKEGWLSSGYPVVVVATTTDVEKVPTGVLGLFKEEIGIEVRLRFPHTAPK